VTRALFLLLLAVRAGAWQLEGGAGVDERGRELDLRWRPYSKTMVDLDIAKRSAQDEEPDWVSDEKVKMTPPERPFGRIQGFTLREKTVRFIMVGRQGPLKATSTDKTGVVAALRAAEGAAAELLFGQLATAPGQAWELVSSAPGRGTLATRGSSERRRVTWHYLDFYREGGKASQLYILLYADKPRTDLPPAPAAGPAESKPLPRMLRSR
jgi:hypothetical protein